MSKSNYITKDDLNKMLEVFGIDLKNELFEIKDEIIGEIKAMREEFDTHQYSHRRINDEVQDHEKRLAALKSTT